MKKIKMYLIARISKDNHAWTNKVRQMLGSSFDVFIPKDNNPWNTKHQTFSQKVFQTDLIAIKNSDLGLMLPEYGNDCAWEAGWYAGSGKPVIVYIHNQTAWLRDWMVKGGIKAVITTSITTYMKLRKDPILKNKKIRIVKHEKELAQAIIKLSTATKL